MQTTTLRVLIVAGALASTVSFGGTAQAQELSNFIGKVLGFTDDSPQINYSERAPLVIPPKRDMRQPAANPAQADPSWPKDPDEKKRARLAKEEFTRGPGEGNAQRLTPEEQAAGVLDGPSRDQRTPSQINYDYDHASRAVSPVELNR